MRRLAVNALAFLAGCLLPWGCQAALGDDATVGLPELEVARALPSPAAVRDALTLIDLWGKLGTEQADARGLSWGSMDACSILADSRWLWTRVGIAVNPEETPLQRRWALSWLVNTLGWERVLQGQLPAPVPLVWFEER